MPFPNFSPFLPVISLPAPFGSILRFMGLDHVLLDFFSHAAAGAATVLLVIFFIGLGIPRRSTAPVRRNNR